VGRAAFSDIDPGQMFAAPESVRFEQRLTELQALGTRGLVRLWGCTTAETLALTRHHAQRFQGSLLSKDTLPGLGELVGRISRSRMHSSRARSPHSERAGPSGCEPRGPRICASIRARTGMGALRDRHRSAEPMQQSLEPSGHLFLCADPNQGFMKSRLSWKGAGLDVVGRTKKLRRFYRTTRALLEAASAAVSALGDGESENYLTPEFSGMEPGERPILVYTDSAQDSVDRVTNEIADLLHRGLSPDAALVVYGDNIEKGALHRILLRKIGTGKVWWLNKSEEKKAPPHGHVREYVRMAYVDTATRQALHGHDARRPAPGPRFVEALASHTREPLRSGGLAPAPHHMQLQPPPPRGISGINEKHHLDDNGLHDML